MPGARQTEPDASVRKPVRQKEDAGGLIEALTADRQVGCRHDEVDGDELVYEVEDWLAVRPSPVES